jgi:beta-glucosidase
LGAANAGLDLEMPTGAFMNRANLLPAVNDGRLERAVVDDKVRRLLGVANRFGWLGATATTASAPPTPDVSIPRYNQQGRQAARQGALEGMVLLKNSGNLLPLDANRVKTIAVIGPGAHPAIATAGGSGKVLSVNAVSFLVGLSDKLGSLVNVTYAQGLPSLRTMGMLTGFSTAAANGRPGVSVEEFADAKFAGAPLASRVEPQLATGSPGFGGDPDFLQLLDTLPAGQAMVMIGGAGGAQREKRYERWTGWYTPSAPGRHTLFAQNMASFRVLLDDRVVVDSSSVPKAALRQVHLDLDARPHKVVFEQTSLTGFGRPFWRVGMVRDDAIVDPLAKQLAAKADVVVLAVGFDSDSETEGADREFELPVGQNQLIREIAAVNPNTVVVVTSGGSVDVAPWVDQVRGLIAAWYPGQEGGNALASVLFGDANPSGRLPISWERSLADNPSFANYYYNDSQHPSRIVYREGVFAGYRGYQRDNVKPMFPFGFGLSYTSFEYSNLKVISASHAAPSLPGEVAPAPGTLKPLYTVSFDVRNSGSRAGADVAQLYVAPAKSKVPRPKRELKGFARVELAPGETRHFAVPLDARSFAYYDAAAKRWQADPGNYAIELGRSSDDIKASAVVTLPRSIDANR